MASRADELMRTLKQQALLARLVGRTTGLTSGENFEAALDFVHAALHQHQFLDSDGHATRRLSLIHI